jgi:2-dehydropantoate 2-reductase
MRICVYGAGAIGGHLALRLAQGGAEISVVARGAHLAAIQRDGITVRTPDGDLNARVAASAEPADLGPQDAVIVTVKAPALPSVAAGIAPLLRGDTPVVFAMNGIPWWYFHHHGGALDGHRLPRIDPGDALWRAIGPERAIGGVVYSALTVIEPGILHLHARDIRLILGEPSGGATPRIAAIADALGRGGMTAVVTARIRDEIWTKLIMNLAASCLALLTGQAVKDVYAEPACVEAGRRLLAEGAAIAHALGAAPDLDVERAIAAMKALAHKSSALQDLERGRTVELDSIFIVPIELARSRGVATPTLDLLVALAKLRLRAAGLYSA